MKNQSKIFNLFLLSLLLATFGSQGFMAMEAKQSPINCQNPYVNTKHFQREEILTAEQELERQTQEEKLKKNFSFIVEATPLNYKPLNQEATKEILQKGETIRKEEQLTTTIATKNLINLLRTAEKIDEDAQEYFIKNVFAACHQDHGDILLICAIFHNKKHQNQAFNLLNQYLILCPGKDRKKLSDNELLGDILHLDKYFYNQLNQVSSGDVETHERIANFFLKAVQWKRTMALLRGYDCFSELDNILKSLTHEEQKTLVLEFFEYTRNDPRALSVRFFSEYVINHFNLNSLFLEFHKSNLKENIEFKIHNQ
jgi:hypothetical protein